MTSTTRLKRILRETDDRVGDRWSELPLLSVSISWGVRRRDAVNLGEFPAHNLSNYKMCSSGDLVINRMRAFQGALGIAPEDGIVSPDYAVLRIDAGVNRRWLAYLMASSSFVSTMASIVKGIGGTEAGNVRTPRLNVRDLGNLAVPIPSRAFQHAIVHYLDRETAQIDKLIAKQEQLIATLRERRRATIAAASVGSFDPLAAAGTPSMSVGMAFSVVLGKMLDAGRQPTPDDITLPYVRAANIQDAGLSLMDVNSMAYLPSEAAALDLRAGDLLVVEGGSIGTSVVLRDDMPNWSFQKTVNRARPLHGASGAWLGYVLRTYRDAGVIETICSGSTIAHFTAEKLRALRIPLVEPARQREIVSELDEQTSRIDTLLAKTERFIELSKERRAALITAAVTGRISVVSE